MSIDYLRVVEPAQTSLDGPPCRCCGAIMIPLQLTTKWQCPDCGRVEEGQ